MANLRQLVAKILADSKKALRCKDMLYKYLIECFTEEEDICLDQFGGS